jgi:hypothetical protein
MNAAVQAPTETRSHAKDYMANYDGPIIKKTVVLGTPVIKQIYKRDTQIFARNALFVTFFARIVFSDKEIDPLEAALSDKIAKMAKKFEDRIIQSQAVMRDNELDEAEKSVNNMPEPVEFSITSPLYRKFVDLMRKADDLLNYYDTLWLNGLITGSAYQEQRFEVKRDLRGVVAFVRNTWIGLQKRVQQDRLSALKTNLGEEAVAAGAAGVEEAPTKVTGVEETPKKPARSKKPAPTEAGAEQVNLLPSDLTTA